MKKFWKLKLNLYYDATPTTTVYIIFSSLCATFLVRWCFQRTLVPSFFFFLSICLFCIWPNYIWLISSNSSTTTTMSSTTTAGVCGYVCVCGYARVCVGMRRCGRVGIGVHKCALVCGCLRVCVWDEFSEYLLENRVPTSADFNTFPIRIFSTHFTSEKHLAILPGLIKSKFQYWN